MQKNCRSIPYLLKKLTSVPPDQKTNKEVALRKPQNTKKKREKSFRKSFPRKIFKHSVRRIVSKKYKMLAERAHPLCSQNVLFLLKIEEADLSKNHEISHGV